MREGHLLVGFGLAGYRSFGYQQTQRVGPMGKIHLVAGPNNSGKSNILRFARTILPQMAADNRLDLSPSDRPTGLAGEATNPRACIAIELDAEARTRAIGRPAPQVADALPEVLGGPSFTQPTLGGERRWLELEFDKGWKPIPEHVDDLLQSLAGNRQFDVSHLARLLTNQHSSNQRADAKRTLEQIIHNLKLADELPAVVAIGAFRQIGTSAPGYGGAEDDLDGSRLIQQLFELQNPRFGDERDAARFSAINAFVGELFDDPEARIEIPHDKNDILIHYEGRRLPLANYGTGMHQTLILAAAATVTSGSIVCIEEPELHLHPTLQRKLLAYLEAETDNQYLIATHSAHLLDAARASISAVRRSRAGSVVSPVIEPNEVAAVAAELGFRASDLVQSNAVVWVEGPSDRIYLRHWLSVVDSELCEGVHYSIMFYGGSLLLRLSADDPAVHEFVSLPRINRNFAVVMDSDRSRAQASIGHTKRRIKRELEQGPARGEAWITAGYTIENYVPQAILQVAVAEVHPGATCRWNGDRYVNPVAKTQIAGRSSEVDKSAIAEAVVRIGASDRDWPYDLRKRVRSLASMIRTANDLLGTSDAASRPR